MIIDGSEGSLKKFLSDLPPVDQVGAEARAAMQTHLEKLRLYVQKR